MKTLLRHLGFQLHIEVRDDPAAMSWVRRMYFCAAVDMIYSLACLVAAAFERSSALPALLVAGILFELIAVFCLFVASRYWAVILQLRSNPNETVYHYRWPNAGSSA